MPHCYYIVFIADGLIRSSEIYTTTPIKGCDDIVTIKGMLIKQLDVIAEDIVILNWAEMEPSTLGSLKLAKKPAKKPVKKKK
jgi:hypothetical protein